MNTAGKVILGFVIAVGAFLGIKYLVQAKPLIEILRIIWDSGVAPIFAPGEYKIATVTVRNPTTIAMDYIGQLYLGTKKMAEVPFHLEPLTTSELGDLDDDGYVTEADMTILKKYYLGFPIAEISPLSEDEFLRRADINEDGIIDTGDMTAMRTIIYDSQKDVSFPVIMPMEEGTYRVKLEVLVGVKVIATYRAVEDVQITGVGIILGHIELQARPAPPDDTWITPLTVRFIQDSAVVETKNVITDNQGNFSVEITPGTYDICVKSPRALSRRINNIEVGGSTGLNFGILLEGDANDDDVIDNDDYGLLSDAYGSVLGDANWDDRCDFNRNGAVDLQDYSLMYSNFGLVGEC